MIMHFHEINFEYLRKWQISTNTPKFFQKIRRLQRQICVILATFFIFGEPFAPKIVPF